MVMIPVGGTKSNRENCLKINLHTWNDASDCYQNDWLIDSQKRQF